MTKLLTDDEVFGTAKPAPGLLSDDEVFGSPKAQAPRPERTAGNIASDVGVTAVKAAVGLPQALVGLVDIPTGGRVGKFLDEAGYRPNETQKILDAAYSDPQQEANRAVRGAEGFIDTAKAAIDNPSVIATTVGESIPQMLGGAGVARGLMKASTRVAPWVAAALGEGVIGAGSAAEQIRGETADGLLTPEQAAAALASGAGTALFGAAGGKMAGRLGLGDVDVMLATGKLANSPAGFVKQVLGSGISEGVFEELPQSIQEQMWQNFALGKPLTDGVGNAAALGLISGAAMGGAGGGYNAAVSSFSKEGQGVQDQTGSTGAPAEAGQGQAPQAAGSDGTSGGPGAAGATGLAKGGLTDAQAGLVEPSASEKALRAPSDGTALERVDTLDAEAGRLDERLAELNRPEAGYGPMFDQERSELQAKRAELVQQRAELTKDWPVSLPGAQTSFSTESGARLAASYALMDAGDLVTSHDEGLRQNPLYPQELQPRERERAASEMQISGIVQKLDPARLGLSADAANGAPIVGADGLVESGNARTIALKRVYQANGQKAEDYRQFLRDNAAQFGITPESVDAMAKPVLVRVRQTPVNRAEFARQANASTVAQMSPSELARSDAKRIDSMEDLQPDDGGGFSGPASRPFVRRFMAKLPATEQAGMIDSAGNLSSSGYVRIRNAVLAKAYGDSPVLQRMVESMDDNLRNVSKALMLAAPRVAQMREAVDQGVRFDADITPELLGAVEELSRLKEAGTSLADALAQGGLLGEQHSAETREILQFLADNARRPRRMADFIVAYMEALDAAGDPNQGSLLEDPQAPAKSDLMGAARRSIDGTAEDSQRRDAGKDPQAGQPAGDKPEAAARRDGGDQGDGPARAAANDASQEWVAFPPESGTLGIPRADMPQIQQKHRGALVNFLEARGITDHQEEVDGDTLKPTQAEFSRSKVARFSTWEEGRNRSVLVSSDGYVLDGHHQWLAKMAMGEPVKVIRFDAPIQKLLEEVAQFPSVGASDGAADLASVRAQAKRDFKDALADLADIASKHTRAAMLPENTPGLMPTLVKLFDAAIRIVGTDLKAATKWVKDQLKADPRTKPLWNKIGDSTYRKAAEQALDLRGTADDLFGVPAQAVASDAAMIDGRAYDSKRDNFKAPSTESFLPKELVSRARGYIDQFLKEAPPVEIAAEDRARAEGLLKPMLDAAAAVKVTYDQKVIDIAKRTGALGQMLAPLKGLGRGAEKLVEEGFDTGKMRDLLRSTIVVSSYEDAQEVLDQIYREFEVVKGRVKNRTDLTLRGTDVKNEGFLGSGYGDVLVNVMISGVQAEIQINVPEILAAKGEEGHKLYEIERTQPKGSETQQAVIKAQAEYYPAASAAAASRNAASESLRGSDRGGQTLAGTSSPSTSDIGPSPGITTASEPLSRSKNSQPGGNFDGNFMGEPSNSNVAEKTGNGYSSTKQQGASDATAQPDQGSAEGKSAGAASQSSRQGRAQPVRGEPGQRDLFGNGAADAAAADQGELGQAGNRGVRGQDEDGRGAEPRGRAGRRAGVPAGRDIPAKSGLNYEFGPDDLTYEGSWVKKAAQNVDAVELLKKLQAEGRQATRAEQQVLAKFVGWGSSEVANSLFGKKLDQQAAALADYEGAVQALDRLGRALNSRDAGFYQAFRVLQAASSAPLSYYSVTSIDRAQLDKAKPDAGTRRWLELRERLQKVMSDDEWAEASRSTQYAHYTSKAVVQSMWRAMERLGFNGGTILEPGAGIGVFPGLMPAGMANNSIYTGIEFDSITGGILKQLFPDERILVESFVDSKLPKNFYDVAAGNPPFSGTKILGDPEYGKLAMPLHDYFFAKTIDRVKPGGLVMFVTSRYTMDKLDDKARQYLADRADLVGAIRLPQTAFRKNAGTEVVTDVLFLRKKVPGQTFEQAQPWAKSVPLTVNGAQYSVNEYFHANPSMVLGQHADTGSMYKDRDYTVTPLDGDIEALFDKAVENLPSGIYSADRGSAAEAAKVREIDFNPKAKKEGNYYVSDAGALMVREGGVGQRVELKSAKDIELIKDFVPLRDALKQAHYDQLNDGAWEASLAALQKAYAAFTKKHGYVNQFTTKTVKVKVTDEETGEVFTDEEARRVYTVLNKLVDDPDWTLVAALEKVNDDSGEIKPSEFLTQRVLGKPVEASISSPSDALLSTLNDLGHVDVPTIANRLGMSEAEAIEALGSAVYRDPEGGWVTADDYLSGNVKRKLDVAREALKADKSLERNVSALEAAQPAPKTPSQINAGLGMNWIPGEIYQQFIQETAGVRARVEWNPRTKQWIVEERSGGSSMRATADWGTDRRNAGDLLEHALTGRKIRVESKVGSGSDAKSVFDASATEAANQKLEALRNEFQSWLWRDAERTDRLVQIYNDTFNTTVPRAFDGRHLTLPGASKTFSVFDHVKRGAWRIVQRGNTYLAHAVGSGKTFQMVISAMEQKRLGLIKKPMVVVPNHMLQQFASEWQQLYPAARLMVADENNFHTDNRRRFVSRVALSDLDGVVITHSAFKLLDLDPEFKAKMIEEQLEYLRAALEEAGGEDGKSGGRKDPKIKQIEKQIENMEQKLEAALSSVGKDKNVRFDELGADFLYVDEAHEYRKLDFATNRQVKGISSAGSARAFDLYMKSRYLEEKTPGRSLVMASGTPVTNTLAELYTVQKFMDRQALADRNLEDFDSWASMFGRENTVLEPNAAGKYEPVTRFSKFVNVPELTQMFREFADVLTSDHLAALLGDKRPRVEGGARKIIITPKGADYAAFQKELEARMQASRDWKPSKDEPNNPDPIIKIIGDGRLAAIDMRFMDPSLPSDPDSKLNRLIDDVVRTAKDTASMEFLDKAGQVEPNKGASMMVFSDLGFGAGVAASRGFNARAWFEKRLRESGIPMGQVAFMSDYKKSSDKLKLFKDVNAGRVRILIGSSKNMGTGVNAQQRLKALFHLDSPWYPADLEQREGRIVRQGNKNPLVQVFAYAAKGTYDENMWKMLASKQFFIDQALSGDANLREIEDLDSQSQYDLAAAMVAEDPRVLQLAGAKAEIEKLQRLYRAHEDQRQRFRQQYQIANDTANFNSARLPAAEADAGKVQDLSGDKFKAKVGGKTFDGRTEWAQALVDKFKELSARVETKPTYVGSISGFDVTFRSEQAAGHYLPRLDLDTPAHATLVTDPGTNLTGLAMRAQNAIADVARLPARMRTWMTEARAQMDALASRLETPFPMAQMLADKVKEAQEIEAAIVADGNDKPFWVERIDTKQGFTIDAPNAEAAVAKAVASNGGAVADWAARLVEQASPEGSKLSRGAGSSGMDIKALQALADRIKAGMPNMPAVHVLKDPSGAPPALKLYILQQGAWNDVEGAMHGGEFYLFASGLQDEARAEHVLAEHEAAHLGLRAVLGRSLRSAMAMIYANNASVRRAATELQRRGKLSIAEATEEVIVDIPTSQLVKLKGWRKLTSEVRDWLAQRGYVKLADKLGAWLDGTLSDQERADLFVANLVQAARDYMAGKRGGSLKDAAGVTMLSGTLADDIARQEKWLQAEARARGYADIEDLLARNYPLFEKLAALWRTKNPADSLLSRAPTQADAAQRAEVIVQTKAGSRAPIDAIAKGLARVTGIERLMGAIYGRAGYLLDRYTPETIKAGVVSDYGVPEAVIDQRAMLQGRQRVQLRQAGALIEKLSTLTRAESRVAYAWMNEVNPAEAKALMDQLPAESVVVLQEVQQMIDRLSRDAVAMGQLTPDAYERNKFAYLRRSYAKHVIEQTTGEKAKRSRVISILGDQYKGRGLTEAATMQQIKNVAPEWWKRKTQAGKADASLKGEKFLRLERHSASGEGTTPLEGMEGKARGKLLEVHYFPAGEALPAKYGDWDKAGTWEARDTKGDKVVLWRDFTKEERETMGEVDEARFAIAKTLHGMIHDVEVGRHLEWLAHTYALKEGETIPGQVVDASERYLDTFKPGEWVRVPDIKIPGTAVPKYGKLAGRYLPGPVWNDLRQTVNGQFKPLGDTYAQILSMWKTAKTALSPAVHMNNVMSNFVMADWHDVGATHTAKALRILLAAHGRDGKGAIGRAGNAAARAGIADREAAAQILNRYKDSGGDIGGWATNEISKGQLEPLLASLEAELAATAGQSVQAQVGVMTALQHALMLRFPSAWEAFKGSKPGKVIGTEATSLLELYQSEDDVFRLAAWLKAKEDGATDLAAGKVSRKSFLDYSVNAPWIQAMRNSGWPFISFTYRAVPMLLETMGKRPHKLMKLMMLAGALNALGVAIGGGGDDDERKLLPEEKAGKIWGMVPKLIRMPWNDANGSPIYLDIRRFIPVGDVLDVGQGHSAVPVLPGLQPGGPLVIMGELLLNRSAFTGKAISLETDTATQQAGKVADHLYKAFAPNVLGLPGTYATTGVVDAAKGRTDAFGREMSVTQAVAASFGLKLGSYPADVMRRNLQAKAAAETAEIDRNIAQLKRQRQTNKISADEFQQAAQVEQEKKAKVMRDLADKLR